MPSELMKRGLPLAAAAGLLALGGCASTPDVRADYDRTVDFKSYHTFAFVSPLGTDRGGYQSIVSQYLKTAAQRELEARGLRLDNGAPQLLVNFNAQLSEKLRVYSMPTMGGYYGWGRGYYGYRAGMYGAWPMYGDTSVVPYNEGRLNIDVVDAARKQLVWEGVVIGSVSDKALENVQPALDAAVAAAFSKYPIPDPAAKAP